MDCFLILPKGIKFLQKFVHFEKDILEDISGITKNIKNRVG